MSSLANVHSKLAHPVDQGHVGAGFRVAAGAAKCNLFGLLGQVEGGNRVLAHRLLILLVQFGVFVLDNLAEAHLRQFLRHQFLVKQAALDRGFVLNERSDHLVQILTTDTDGFYARRFGKALDLDLELPCLVIEADIALARIVTAFASGSEVTDLWCARQESNLRPSD